MKFPFGDLIYLQSNKQGFLLMFSANGVLTCKYKNIRTELHHKKNFTLRGHTRQAKSSSQVLNLFPGLNETPEQACFRCKDQH